MSMENKNDNLPSNNNQKNLENLGNLDSLTPDEIIDLVFKGGKIQDLNLKTFNKFMEVCDNNREDTAGYYFYINFIINHIDSFQENYHTEIVNKLIDIGEGEEVCKNFEKFKGINTVDIANKLTDKGQGYYVILNIEKFPNINGNEILTKVIDNHPWSQNSAKNDIPRELLEKLPLFSNLDINFANKLIESGDFLSLSKNLKSFSNLDSDIAFKLIFTEHDTEVIDNLEKFNNLNQNDLADKIIESGRGYSVIWNYKKFNDLDQNKIVNKLIDHNQLDTLSAALSQGAGIENLDMSIANKLLDLKHEDVVIRSLHSFIKFDTRTVNRLIDAGHAGDVSYYLHDDSHYPFDILDSTVAFNLIEHGEGGSVLSGYKKFSDLKNEDVIDKILESENSHLILKESPDALQGLDPDVIKYIQEFQSNKKDSTSVYKLRNEYDLKEIMDNYNYFRIKSWEKENTLKPEDEILFKQIREFIDEKTLGKLWEDSTKEELHIIAPQIIRMYGFTKLELGYSPDTFRGEYLERIINDNAQYTGQIDDPNWVGDENITALRKFNNIVQGLSESRVQVFKDASTFEQTKALAEKLLKENPYKNWENLKKYYELAELLKKREVLEKLQNLKNEGKEKHYKFFSDLAFHPGSKIPMQTVFQFMENPARFLDIEDDHSGEAHERKKPSNYTKFEYLDISAEDLRDALIEGNLDSMQYFKPFEAHYSMPNSEYLSEVLKMTLDEALGSFKNNIKGTAKNPGKLFQMTQQVLKKYGKEYKDLARDYMTNEIKNDLEQVLFNKDFGIKDTRKFNDYLVKIHPKSEPEGHLAGNDTACCMPFGSGKNNVYMYNLGCSILTIQRKVGDKYRTIAQSVLTPDVDIHHSISELVKQVQDEALLSNIITDDLTQNKKIILTADNIEVAPNANSYKPVIEKIYADFISKYVHEINSPDLDINRMLIGKGYSDLNFSHAESIDNTFIPITPVAYSDNYGEEVYELTLSESSKIIPPPNYGVLEKSEKQIIDPNLPRGLSYLTAHDTLRVSYMEGKVYAENESLVQYIHRIGNELTAKDINNNFKNRPNLSLKIEDENGAMLGYMIAYEGAEKSYDHGDIDDETKISTGEKVIYISDLAADTTKSKLAGGKLINTFGELINREYLQKGNALPIVAQARENTSYKIIQKHLSELGQKYGYRFELEENGSYESGGETMYQIKLKPVRIES